MEDAIVEMFFSKLISKVLDGAEPGAAAESEASAVGHKLSLTDDQNGLVVTGWEVRSLE
jgi:hypothetical protein